MKKENYVQVNLKNQEVSKMSTANIPYNNKQLLKWSCFTIQEPASIWLREKDGEVKTLSNWEIDKMSQHPKKSWKGLKNFELINTPLLELGQKPGYEMFIDKLNWLYNNYSKENYQLVWEELQDYNESRKLKFIQKTVIARADYFLNKQVEEWKHHFYNKKETRDANGKLKIEFEPFPEWIEKLTDNQRSLLLDRARTCYGLEPEEVELDTKTIYTVPERLIKDGIEDGTTIYWSQEELDKDHVSKKLYNNFTDVVGKFKTYTDTLKRLAENAVIRDASWMAKFNNTECDLREQREVEDDESHNKMVPITDMQGPDSPYGLNVEFRDFLEPIYAEDEGR